MKHSARYLAARRRAKKILASMTLAEKIGQMSQYGTSIYTAPEGVRADLYREGKVGSYLGVLGLENINAVHRDAAEAAPGGLPILFGFDVIHGYRTTFPVPLAQSCSWDPELVRQGCEVAAREAYRDGMRWTFSPMVDVARDPRWGRIMEGYGEDPFLTSAFARAAVRGYQGEPGEEGKPDRIMSCLKHYCAYGACEGGRDYNSVRLAREDVCDMYLPPFRAGVEAGAATVMSSFNDINGIPSSMNRWLLTDVLRGAWDFEGFVVSDYGAVEEMCNQATAADEKEATLLSIRAGLNMHMAGGLFNRYVPELVEEGLLTEAWVDERTLPILTQKVLWGILDGNAVTEPQDTGAFSPAHREAARKAARESMVLLKNENDLLPLPSTGKIALIGPAVEDGAGPLGGWACAKDPAQTVTVAEGMREAFPRAQIRVARGCGYDSDDREGFAEALDLARWADTVIYCGGENEKMTGEAKSRVDLHFPGVQEELILALGEVTHRLVLVSFCGRPLIYTRLLPAAGALLLAWQPGTECGHALADLLSGACAPAGRLTTSQPHNMGQIPCAYNANNTGRPVLPDGVIAYRSAYIDGPFLPLFPFGFGLTYTTFEFSPVTLSAPRIPADGTLSVSFSVTNTGRVAAPAVAQLYVRDLVSSRARPIRELKGFGKVMLAPGETRRMTLKLPAGDLAFTDDRGRCRVESGTFALWVGADCTDDSRRVTFEVR